MTIVYYKYVIHNAILFEIVPMPREVFRCPTNIRRTSIVE